MHHCKSKKTNKNQKCNFVSECTSKRPKTTATTWKVWIRETNSANLSTTQVNRTQRQHNDAKFKIKFYHNILVGMRF